MKPYYFEHINNFGDELNDWLWARLIPDLLSQDDETLLLGIGTYLTSEWVPQGKKIVVFSSGAGYGPVPQVDATWTIYCVRGPLTAQALGLDSAAAVTDAAVLVRRLYQDALDKKYKLAYMPHHVSDNNAGEFWRSVCEDVGAHYIDPHLPVEQVMGEIKASELLITEALHGAIVADSFRVPWCPVLSGDHVLRFKWDDWCQSLGLQYHPDEMKCIASDVDEYTAEDREGIVKHINSIAQSSQPLLSDEELLENKTTELEERLEQMKKDYIGQQSGAMDWPTHYATTIVSEAQRRKQVIASRESDVERWSNPEQLEALWNKRAEVAATLVPAGSNVLDLGCGAMAVEGFLPAGCSYQPCDIVQRDERTLVCNFNDGEFPDPGNATIITVLGVLGYIYDVPAFLNALHGYKLPIILSYIPTDSGLYPDREAHGWVNSMSWQELATICSRVPFQLLNSKRVDGGQILVYMVPA